MSPGSGAYLTTIRLFPNFLLSPLPKVFNNYDTIRCNLVVLKVLQTHFASSSRLNEIIATPVNEKCYSIFDSILFISIVSLLNSLVNCCFPINLGGIGLPNLSHSKILVY